MTVSRRAAKVTHDEVTRMVKAVLSLGLPVSSVDFDGSKVSVKIAHSGETSTISVDGRGAENPVEEVPTL